MQALREAHRLCDAQRAGVVHAIPGVAEQQRGQPLCLMSLAAEEVRGPAGKHASRSGKRMSRPAWWLTLHHGC